MILTTLTYITKFPNDIGIDGVAPDSGFTIGIPAVVTCINPMLRVQVRKIVTEK